MQDQGIRVTFIDDVLKMRSGKTWAEGGDLKEPVAVAW